MTVRQYIKGDRIIWIVVLILFVYSLLSVYTSTDSLAYRDRSGDTFYFLMEQFKFAIGGLIVIFIVHLFHYNFFKTVAEVVLVASIALLIYTLIKGDKLNEAVRWVGVGSRTFQPSEIAKIALMMYVARVLAVNQNNIGDFKKVFLKIGIAVALVCALILPANLSTAAMVFFIALVMMFVGRIPVKHILLLIATAILGLIMYLAVTGAFKSVDETAENSNRTSTWKSRIETFLTGEGNSYQADQAKIAIVKGGVLPNGPGSSTQRNLLPHPYSDFIYAIIVEEYGSILGGLVLVVLYLWLLFRTGIIVRRSRSTFGAFLAYGLAFSLVFQAFINMGVTVGLLPVTGQTLPLISKGGTSILTTSAAIGMILSVSAGLKREEEAEAALLAEQELAEKEEQTESNEGEEDI